MKFPFVSSLRFQFAATAILLSYLLGLALLLFMLLRFGSVNLQSVLYQQWYFEHIANPVDLFYADSQKLQSQSDVASWIRERLDTPIVLPRNADKAVSADIQIKAVALVDSKSRLVEQWGAFSFNPGDVGAQLPISSRDDLSDALLGAHNTGIEPLENGHRLVIKAVRNGEGEPVGALLTQQWWRKDMIEVTLWDRFQATPLNSLFLIPLVPLFAVVLGLALLYVLANWRVKGMLKAFHQTTKLWSSGELSVRLPERQETEVSRSFQRLNKMVDNLQAVHRQNKELVSVKERQFLAAELHDTVKQSLFANNLMLTSCRNHLSVQQTEQAERLLTDVISNNQLAFSQVNELINSLQKDTAQQVVSDNLAAAIKELAERYQLELRLNFSLPERIQEKHYHLLLRASGEAMLNSVKHAMAGKACLSLLLEENQMIFSYTDNGKAPDEIVMGQGLSLMKARVEQIGGEFTLQTNTADTDYPGMKLKIVLPLAGGSHD